jgi:hypothetical protein
MMSSAIVGLALTAVKANAGSGACAPENVAANAVLVDRYVAAVNAGDTAARCRRCLPSPIRSMAD